MRLSKLKLCNFRCFGPEQTVVEFSPLTVAIGGNSTGKTALCHALLRLFGTSRHERQILPEDFHLPQATAAGNRTSASLSLEAVLELPELASDPDGIAPTTVPDVFRFMVVDDQGATPYVRIRLTARWTPGSTPDGEIEDELEFVKVPESQSDGQGDRVRVYGQQRERIQALYVPALRSPTDHLKMQSGAMLWRLVNAIAWSTQLPTALGQQSTCLEQLFDSEAGLTSVREIIQTMWGALHDDPQFGSVVLSFGSPEISDLLRASQIQFSPAPGVRGWTIDQLGDGHKSLFYVALFRSVIELERRIRTAPSGQGLPGLRSEDLHIPSFTLMIIEEPENHIAPQLLGSTLASLTELSLQPSVQVLVSSHSASTVGRVDPSAIRHFRREGTAPTVASRIVIPERPFEVHTFVREGVRAFPELYFAKLVIVCEGDSEEVVLPRVFEALGKPVDQARIAVVPLGGRHVNHFWRLLAGLKVPYLTLLDLDRERETGGWSRIKYVLEQLLATGYTPEQLFGKDAKNPMECMANLDVADTSTMGAWITFLRNFNVFFSEPLDLDLLLLCAFRAEYETYGIHGTGPRIPAYGDEREKRLDAATVRVLGSNYPKAPTYPPEDRLLFPYYTYLFLDGSKPTTHLACLSQMPKERLVQGLPEPLVALTKRVSALLGAP